jgi:DNA-binding IclR family transcriptional regulator
MFAATRTAPAPVDRVAAVFRDPGAVWTIDEVAGRFGLSIGRAVRVMADLEAAGLVRRIGDEYVPGPRAASSA